MFFFQDMKSRIIELQSSQQTLEREQTGLARQLDDIKARKVSSITCSKLK